MSTLPLIAEPQPVAASLESVRIPPLRAGDRLTRHEYLRRYEAAPEVKHAELIEGVVYMTPPVSGDHAVPQFTFNGILFVYQWQTSGVEGGDNATVKLDGDNAPQPDGYLRLLPECGGQSTTVDRFVEGAPELVAEVSASSVSYDLHDKLNAYRRNGVREYVVWRVWDRAVDWFILRDGRFERHACEDGVFHSQVFPGLWIDAEAMISGNTKQVMEILERGIASEAHREFVQLNDQRNKA